MRTVNEIRINADAARIFGFAANTAQWPTYLPHYRYVRALRRRGTEMTVEMGASRSGIPVSWTAVQRNDAAVPEIHFTHIRGWTKGMDVIWRFVPDGAATRVIIEHDLQFRFPFAANFIAEHIIGRFFVHFIAGKTLARMRDLSEASDSAEAGEASSERVPDKIHIAAKARSASTLQ